MESEIAGVRKAVLLEFTLDHAVLALDTCDMTHRTHRSTGHQAVPGESTSDLGRALTLEATRVKSHIMRVRENQDSTAGEGSGAGTCVTTGESVGVDKHCKTGNPPIVDKHFKTGKPPIVDKHCPLGDHQGVEQYSIIGEQPIVDKHSTTAENPQLDKHSTTKEHAFLDKHSTVGELSILEKHSITGEHPEVDKHSILREHPIVDKNSTTGEHPKVDKHCTTGEHPKVDKNSATKEHQKFDRHSTTLQLPKMDKHSHVWEPAIVNKHSHTEKTSSLEKHFSPLKPVRIYKHSANEKPIKVDKHSTTEKPIRVDKHSTTEKPIKVDKHFTIEKSIKVEKHATMRESAKIDTHFTTGKPPVGSRFSTTGGTTNLNRHSATGEFSRIKTDSTTEEQTRLIKETKETQETPLTELALLADYERRKKKGELPDKVFVTRRSVLTELFEISHIRTIYHIFVAILIVFSLNTILYDVLEKGTFSLNFEMIQYAFGKFPKVMTMWVVMQLSTLLIVYPAFYYYAIYRLPGNAGLLDIVWICLVVIYQLAFLLIPLMYLVEHELPPASSVIITTEQIRLMMKTHAFIRENTARVMYRKKDDDNDGDSLVPDFSKYLYFLFCPTLVYRDNYPRTQTISWRYVVTNFLQVLACLFYTYYIFERFCVPVFQNFNKDHITPKAFILSMFGCMMPGTLVLFIGFFAILHSWLNAFAEMLRFGDRLFYKDWWNSTTFSNYYRTWNVVVHDWLYTYIYRDVCKLIGSRYRAGAMACVFLISAVFHEYILTCTFKFFYPVLFVMFTGAGFGFIFLTDKGSNRSWNVFMWVALFIGNGMLMCLYSMEFYARQNCVASMENLLDFVIPRSWFCVSPSSKL